MKKVGFILSFMIPLLSWAQHGEDVFCDLESDSKTWAFQYKKAIDLEEELYMVVDKILADTDYLRENPPIENPEDRRVMGPLPCTHECSMRFGVVYDKREGMVLDLVKYPALEDLLYEFTADNIDRIDLNEYQENDIYKHAADKRSGIVIYTSDEALQKKIRTTLKDIAKAERRAERDKLKAEKKAARDAAKGITEDPEEEESMDSEEGTQD